MRPIRAIIADDEKPLREYLRSRLAKLWPELVICAEAENGLQALELIEKETPQIAFLDIKMPGLSGIEVARRMTASSRVVFITAYDQFAIEAFENEVIDYLLKPVTEERLQKTVARLKKQVENKSDLPLDIGQVMQKLMSRMPTPNGPRHLQWIKARHGDSVRMIAVGDISYFKSEDKYTVVKTREGEFLIKTTISRLAQDLDPAKFWRVHRGAIVNVHQIAKVDRSFAGRLDINLKDLPDKLTVSRTYAHRFKQM
jgi:DNA-binding LytR/AlgR family response regulator